MEEDALSAAAALPGSLAEYAACVARLSSASGADGARAAPPITRRAHARVGLLGNPSDGFFGKTIAVSLANFWAEVSIGSRRQCLASPRP